MTVSVRDNGADRLLKTMARGLPSVTVGIHKDDGAVAKEGDSALTVAEVAVTHEFGVGVPERSWLRGYVDENEPDIKRQLRKAVGAVTAARVDPQTAADRIGLYIVGGMKDRIMSGIQPPLTDETKRRKEEITGGTKTTPLVLFGQLLSSIAHRTEP